MRILPFLSFHRTLISISVPAGKSAARSAAATQLREFLDDFDEKQMPARIQERAAERKWLFTASDSVRGSGDWDPHAIDELLHLKRGELSAVFHSPTGVHVVQLLDKQAGDMDLVDVQAEVRMHMLIYLLEHLATQSREQMPLRAAE